jgi:hypothetical protein
MEMTGQLHAPHVSLPEKASKIGSCVGSRVVLDALEKRKIAYPCPESKKKH